MLASDEAALSDYDWSTIKRVAVAEFSVRTQFISDVSVTIIQPQSLPTLLSNLLSRLMPSTRNKKQTSMPRPATSRNRRDDGDDSATDIDDGFNNEPIYEVEKVVGKMFDEHGQVSYNLKWKGYDETSWEKKDDCSCPKLIESYENFLAGRGTQPRSPVARSSSPRSQQVATSRRASGRSNGESRRTSGRFK